MNMQEVKTKVKSVQANGTYDSKFGLLYKFDYEFEDGVNLMCNHKTQTGNFSPGAEVVYEIKGNNTYGNWGSIKRFEEGGVGASYQRKKESTYNDDVQTQIIRQSSLKIALEHLSIVGSVTKENVIKLAEYYTEFVKTGL